MTSPQDLYDLLEKHLRGVLEDVAKSRSIPLDAPRRGITVSPCTYRQHGEVCTNAALVLAPFARCAPRDLAAELAQRLALRTEVFRSAEVAGPGFVNLRLAWSVWHDQVRCALRTQEDFGSCSVGNGEKVHLEFVSANPTGPLTVAHTRGAILGDVLARLLEKAGYEVCREYYQNDAGRQVDVVAHSLRLRYLEALGVPVGDRGADFYPGDYIKDFAAQLLERHGGRLQDLGEAEWLPVFREFAVSMAMERIRRDLKDLGVHFDVFASERALQEKGMIEQAISRLHSEGLLYEGVLPRPKGKQGNDWEERKQLLFRARRFGDDSDRPLRKADGEWTYFAGDIAYHMDKMQRGFNNMITVWGADHTGYVKRMQSVVAALGRERARLRVVICQMVSLLRDGKQVRMSKRAGVYVTLRDLLLEVGADAIRFWMLTRRAEAALDFDLSAAKELSEDNPVFYVQYAHARICSLLRRVVEIFPNENVAPATLAGVPLECLDSDAELEIMQRLAEWPRVVKSGAKCAEPHRVVFYLQALAESLHGFWSLGNRDSSRRVLRVEDRKRTLARLALVRAAGCTIASGLRVCGIEPLEELR